MKELAVERETSLVGRGQEEGFTGRLVGGMIRRSVRKSFRNVYWGGQLDSVPDGPVVFVCNHHGWFDGYLMFHAVSALGKRSLDWIAEFGAFPLFAKVGGRPFPPDDAGVRAATIRETVRAMNRDGRSLVLFAEGVLHYPPEVLPFGKSLTLIAKKVPEAQIVPVAIAYEHAMHEKPEGFVRIGRSLGTGVEAAERAHPAVCGLLDELNQDIRQRVSMLVLAEGTPSVNERLDMRKFFGGGR